MKMNDDVNLTEDENISCRYQLLRKPFENVSDL